MNTHDLERDFVGVLRRRDKTWFEIAATSKSKHPGDVTYADLASVSFGEFTASRAEADLEFLFGVCLPLSLRDKKWTADQHFNYLSARSKKKAVNLKLARSRTDPPGMKTTITIAFASFLLLAVPILLFVIWQKTHLITATLAMLALLIPAVMSIDYLWTYSYYSRLARRIEEMRG